MIMEEFDHYVINDQDYAPKRSKIFFVHESSNSGQ